MPPKKTAVETASATGYAESYVSRAETVVDSRFVYKLVITGRLGFLSGPIPMGAKRLRFIYDFDPKTSHLAAFPRLSHSSGYGMTADMLGATEDVYTRCSLETRNSQYKFSVICLLYPEETREYLETNHRGKPVHREFVQFMTNANAAIKAFDRDKLAVIYAQFDTFMETFLGVDFMTMQMFDPEKLFAYFRKILEEGPYVMLRPEKINLSSKIKQPSKIKTPPNITPESDDGLGGGDDEYTSAEGVDVDDEEFDYYHGKAENQESVDTPRPTRTLLLKNISRIKPLVDTSNRACHQTAVKWTLENGRGGVFVIASQNEQDVKFPMVDLSMLSSFDWHKFAIVRYVEKAFNRDKHYFCTSTMVELEIARIGREPEDGKRALFPVKLDVTKTRAAIDELVQYKELFEIIKEIKDDVEGAKPVNVRRIFCKNAFDEEQRTKQFIEYLVNTHKENLFSNRLRENLDEVIRRFAPVKQLAEEQIKAIYAALTQRLTFIIGPGGSGKTLVMSTIQRILRAAYPTELFIFASFKNGIVLRMESMFGDGYDDNDVRVHTGFQPEINPVEPFKDARKTLNVFKTLDSFIFAWKFSKMKLEPRAVFVEEAGQTSGSHLEGLLSVIKMSNLCHFVMIGDENQRAPIKQGTPFKSLSAALAQHGVVHKLETVHRTDSRELQFRQNCVLAGFWKQALAPPPDGEKAFSTDIWDRRSRGRMYEDTMIMFADKIWAWLEMTAARKGLKYADIMGICPYNDYCEIGNAVMNYVFFEGAERYQDVIKREVLPRKCDNQFIAVDSRVVFNVTHKPISYNAKKEYARGEIGTVMRIVDIQLDRDGDVLRSLEIKNTRAAMVSGFHREFHVKMNASFTTKIRISDKRELLRIMSPAGFITCDRSQGLEFPHVIGIFPWGMNIATRDVVTTIWGRPRLSLHVIGEYNHLKMMITTPPEPKNYSLDDKDFLSVEPRTCNFHPRTNRLRITDINPIPEEEFDTRALLAPPKLVRNVDVAAVIHDEVIEPSQMKRGNNEGGWSDEEVNWQPEVAKPRKKQKRDETNFSTAELAFLENEVLEDF